MDNTDTTQFKPPYMPFATFWSFIEALSQRPLPPRIDRSLMASKSGTDQANLIATLRAFDLIDGENRVHALRDLTVADEEERRVQLGTVLRTFYPSPVAVSEQDGTEQQLSEAFRDNYNLSAADTRRKAQTFFLHAMREAGLKISANFPQTRSGSGGPGAPKAKTSGKTSNKPRTQTPPAAPNKLAKGDSYSVSLNSGGTVSVDVSVNLFDLSKADRDFVLTLVDALKGYPAQPATEGPTE